MSFGGSYSDSCPKCEDRVSLSWKYCPWCGAHIQAEHDTTK